MLSVSGMFPISDRHATVFVNCCPGWLSFPHSLLPHIYLVLPRTSCHREIKCQGEWEVSVCWDCSLYACAVVWRRLYVPVQKPVFILWWRGMLAGAGLCLCNAVSTEKLNKTMWLQNQWNALSVLSWNDSFISYLTPLENGVDFWNEMPLTTEKLSWTKKMNQNKTFCLILNFHFISNKKYFLSLMQFAALVMWKPRYSMNFLSKMVQVYSWQGTETFTPLPGTSTLPLRRPGVAALLSYKSSHTMSARLKSCPLYGLQWMNSENSEGTGQVQSDPSVQNDISSLGRFRVCWCWITAMSTATGRLWGAWESGCRKNRWAI